MLTVRKSELVALANCLYVLLSTLSLLQQALPEIRLSGFGDFAPCQHSLVGRGTMLIRSLAGGFCSSQA